MNRLLSRALSGVCMFIFVFATCSFSCAQNGPTNPSVTLSWVPSTTTSPAGTGICVYKGTVANTYTKPALACSDTSTLGFTGCVAGVCTGYLDSSLTATNRGTTYHYAVSEKFGTNTESAYSNDATAAIPNLNPPTLNPPVENGKNQMPGMKDKMVAVVRPSFGPDGPRPSAPDGLTAVVLTGSAPGSLVATVNPGTK